MKKEKIVNQTGLIGAWITFSGILVSGPIGMGLEMLIHPNLPWQGPAVWAENFHLIQLLPYVGGLFMISGFVVLMAVIHQMAGEEQKIRTLIALVLTGAFFGLICFNYIIQITFLPVLALQYNPLFDPLVFTFSLLNPNSLCWGIEMWGYALLGGALWLAAPVFNRNGLEKVSAAVMTFDGVISVFGGIYNSLSAAWVMSLPGLLSYMFWYIAMIALGVCFLLVMRRRLNELSEYMGGSAEVDPPHSPYR